MYSSKHLLANSAWSDAMEYIRDAYNLSISDEPEFVSRYVLEECEKVVEGLENILNTNTFRFKEVSGRHPHAPSTGHQLVEVRGEKISGALNFINSIIEFGKVIKVKEFVERIEACNKIIQPILVKESKIIHK